ncbi:hypothetical protein JM946_27805 [Steroidobacter sp. S1-65]|uniref:Ankyrin repeat domain-containing protein n=1 Tax=Steroidobacter gossypii TaxID=2805490 RepID=A0ABS1X5P9_9GAMM|nr:hypothetical protein [Steroidobacter gossypii]MBM0108556.1 hypothetical protein [Steroidobacter gossypii]
MSLLQGESFAATSDDDDDELRASTPESEDKPTLLDDVLREAADTPALHLAATQGHFEMYGAFATALVQLDLPMEERMRVLDARDGRGRPALWRAIANKRLGCYDALSNAAQRAGIGIEEQVQLLVAKDRETGLAPHQLAIQLGIAGACDKLCETLKDIGIPEQEIRRAVFGGDGKGNDSRTLRRNSGSQEELERALERTSHSPPPSPQQRAAHPRTRNSSPSSDEQPERKKLKRGP